MNYRLVAAVTVSAFVIGCQCGMPSKNLCEATTCSTGLECDPLTGKCRVAATGGSSGSTGGGLTSSGGGSVSDGGTGGGSASTGGGTTSTGGGSAGCGNDLECGGNKPWCLFGANDAGTCVQCKTYAECGFNQNCDPLAHTCSNPVTGGGTATGGGSATTGGGAGTGGGSAVGGGTGATGGGSNTGNYCLARQDAGVRCTSECAHGFTCIGGFCALNGGTGPLQITLRFDQVTDVDLHVREPLPDGGHCEIYYGDKNLPDSGYPSSCGAVGWLDLDSNGACSIDRVNIENVIYDPLVPPPHGRYDVYVDYYQYCLPSASPVHYEVEVRANGTTRYYCGSYTPLQADEGGRGDGQLVTSFVVP